MDDIRGETGRLQRRVQQFARAVGGDRCLYGVPAGAYQIRRPGAVAPWAGSLRTPVGAVRQPSVSTGRPPPESRTTPWGAVGGA
ncbi:hypothetical protein ACHBTE_31260 [Streptomyces sp. M41]|uniref:hypothetical protein n=1 Tax=Streptomyces sp. M41 TaxID=3059412 RepID=UPI00374C9E27